MTSWRRGWQALWRGLEPDSFGLWNPTWAPRGRLRHHPLSNSSWGCWADGPVGITRGMRPCSAPCLSVWNLFWELLPCPRTLGHPNSSFLPCASVWGLWLGSLLLFNRLWPFGNVATTLKVHILLSSLLFSQSQPREDFSLVRYTSLHY